jgi:hypothetical protein
MRYKNINGHIDKGCPDPPAKVTQSSKTEWSKIMAPKSSKGKEKFVSHNVYLAIGMLITADVEMMLRIISRSQKPPMERSRTKSSRRC